MSGSSVVKSKLSGTDVAPATAALLQLLYPEAKREFEEKVAGGGQCVLFFSASDGSERAKVVTVSEADFASAWSSGSEAIAALHSYARHLRVDWVTGTQKITLRQLHKELHKTKRNYFRLGISLDPEFRHAFLEAEINGNAMLYGGNTIAHAVVNEKNFLHYARRRHGLSNIDFSPSASVWLFSSGGAFISADALAPVMLHSAGRNVGRRDVGVLDVTDLDGLIASGSAYLARQVNAAGRFEYGVHPCFDRPIRAYNSLRHASTVYAMLEAWEVTRDPAVADAIERAVHYLTEDLIRQVERDGQQLAFLLEANNELKLGGGGVCLLALTKYSELFGTDRFLPLLEMLGRGVVFMQNKDSGGFDHVLNYPTLTVKDAFRIIYYDGEAAFGLMRLFRLTGDRQWLDAVERAFEYFLQEDHWQAHDHWLGYCVDELTAISPDRRYFEFGFRNFRKHLAFVLDRITTFPTLLELMTSAEKMLHRLAQDDAHRDLLQQVDTKLFYEALHYRAHYLLNGHFWPELAMYFANPGKIEGSFFIRHHGFRVRIDDVEHYLSGLVAYRHFLAKRGGQQPADPARVEWKPEADTAWNARNLTLATGGNWTIEPPAKWKATGVFTHPDSFVPGRIALHRRKGMLRGMTQVALRKAEVKPSAVLTNYQGDMGLNLPQLWVEQPEQAIFDMASYARERFTGKVIAVTGSAGKTSLVAMMARALRPFGLVGQTGENANLPIGVAWNLASMRWTDPHQVLELSIGRMRQSTQLARPDVAIFTNIQPAHLQYHMSLHEIARRKAAIFLGMPKGAVAVINTDMEEWETVHSAAEDRGLRIVLYGTSEACRYRLLSYDSAFQTVNASVEGSNLSYTVGAPGEHMALNSLAVIAAARALGHPLAAVLEEIGAFQSLPGRGEQFETSLAGHLITVIDEAYNANPGSMHAALKLLGNQRPKGRRIAVLGEMAELGSDAASYHTAITAILMQNGIDRVYVMGDLYAAMWEALPPQMSGSWVKTLEELAEKLRLDVRDGDCLLLKGSHSTGLHGLADNLRSGKFKV